MGRLTIFEKRLDIAADDLYLMASYIIILRLGWLAIIVISFISIVNDCNFTWLVQLYVFIDMILSTVILANETTCFFVSTSGTITDTLPRRHMSKIAHTEIALLILDMGWQGFGIYTVFGPPISEENIMCTNVSYLFSATLVKLVAIWGALTSSGFFLILFCKLV
jgi:hypothetical protein